MKGKKKVFDPTICVTHQCNLNCVYCYEKHKGATKMDLDTAKSCVDYIFTHIPEYAVDGVTLGFIGGEPLFEFELLRQLYEYTMEKYPNVKKVFYATTNGTLLTEEMKIWFREHCQNFVLGLSLDGTAEVHNHNRSDSFSRIDTEFFCTTWPEQAVKMTLSEYSIPHLAESIKFIHSLGFKKIRGVNLAEGNFNWDEERVIRELIPQLEELVEYYLEQGDSLYNQMLDKQLEFCEAKGRKKRKWCGTGVSCLFFDVDGKRYPCSYFSPMTFSEDELEEIAASDFTDEKLFVDDKCFEECYLYPLCPTCAGANYQTNKSFGEKNKIHCKMQKLIALFAADLQAKKISKNPDLYDELTTYYTIEAIKKIKELYYDEFKEYGL